MQGKVVVITGCSQGGIGHALCREFARNDCRVYATARRLEAMGHFEDVKISTLKLDVTSDGEVSGVVESVLEREGRIDIVVNNAGRPHSGPLAETSLADAQKTFDTNVFGPLRLSQAVFPHMAARKSGTIVNIGSIVGEIPAPWGGIYGASKAALVRLSEVFYMEAAPFNIHVVHISPGGIKTNIVSHALEEMKLRDDSFYKPWFDAIYKALHVSVGPLSLTPDQFAQRVVKQVLKPKPPRYMTLGAGAFATALLQWLPRTIICWMMWVLLGEDGLGYLYRIALTLRRLSGLN